MRCDKYRQNIWWLPKKSAKLRAELRYLSITAMATLVFASATDIDRWAATRASQERVPELLRRLVYATTEAPTLVDFPSGDAVQLDGWDGAVELNEDHPIIPKGASVWETGTSKTPKKKADEDYEKRTKAPPVTARGPVVLSETAFVFVTPRRWAGKEKWAAERRGEKKWRDKFVPL